MDTTTTPNGFGALGLHEALVEAASALGYEEPTAIQREAIPPLLQGRDVLGQAATGTGKTAAFALPMLHLIGKTAEDARRVRGLILVPTRELAMQVAEAVHKYGRLLGTSVLPIYGGQSVGQQLRALKRGVDVVVATPGRALDHINRGTLDLSTVEFLVLDEADEMLDMGFAEELEAIVAAVPSETPDRAVFGDARAAHPEHRQALPERPRARHHRATKRRPPARSRAFANRRTSCSARTRRRRWRA